MVKIPEEIRFRFFKLSGPLIGPGSFSYTGIPGLKSFLSKENLAKLKMYGTFNRT